MIRQKKIKTSDISFHGIKVNLDKSSGSYVYDDNTGREYLDFFGMYSSQALGYNHPSFSTAEFKKEVIKAATVKVCNCEMSTEIYESFVEDFSNFAIPEQYTGVHFACTGGLAVEGAIKTALYHMLSKGLRGDLPIISFKKSFHGITSYGNFTTDRVGPAGKRLNGYPDMNWPKANSVSHLKDIIESGLKVGAVILEPIQCTSGDKHISLEDLDNIRQITSQHKIPLIFDEVQTGFCATGNVWFFQKLSWSPDIVVFGKKSQVSGFFVKEGFDQIFNSNEAGRLCITFDGDIIDMVRCKNIIRVINHDDLLSNVRNREQQIMSHILQIPGIINPRSAGLLIGFDLKDRKTRDTFVRDLSNIGMICNPTGEKSVRMRPSLSVTESEISHAMSLVREAI
tara:strand:- start:65 stop:1255 length:1191 start_codon:yes stop_codon:yes gene_type:complete